MQTPCLVGEEAPVISVPSLNDCGVMLQSTTATFTWSDPNAPDGRIYQPYVNGGVAGNPTAGTSVNVSGLPDDGSTIVKQIRYSDDGGMSFEIGDTCTCTAVMMAASIPSLLNCDETLTSSSAIIEWSDPNRPSTRIYQPYVNGGVVGGPTQNLSAVANELPTDGSTITKRIDYANDVNSPFITGDECTCTAATEVAEPCDTILDCAALEASVIINNGNPVTCGQGAVPLQFDVIGCDGNYAGVGSFIGLDSDDGDNLQFMQNVGLTNFYMWTPGTTSVERTVNFTIARAEEPDNVCRFSAQVLPCEITTLNLSVAPEYVGHGTNSPAGRGGQVLCVENLNDSGAGSLRAALEASGPRTVIFNVGGHIRLNTRINITNPFVSVYGQTAPGDGITVSYLTPHQNIAAPIYIQTSDVLMMHVRVRPLPASIETCCLDCISCVGPNAQRICLIHCSLSWSTDENLEAWDRAQDIFISNCLNYEGLLDSTNQGTSTTLAKSSIFGGGVGAPYIDGISYQHNVHAQNIGRNPRMGGGTNYDVFQNVTYNPTNFTFESDARTAGIDAVGVIEGNWTLDGPNSPSNPIGGQIIFTGVADNIAYISGNQRISTTGAVSQADIVGNYTPLSTRPTDCPRPEYSLSMDEVISRAGATLPKRDGNDSRIVSEIYAKTGSRKSLVDGQVVTASNGGTNNVAFIKPATVFGQPLIDTNQVDKVPADWKLANGYAANDDMTTKFDSVGYSEMENFIYQTFGIR